MVSRVRKSIFFGAMLLALCVFIEGLSLIAYGVATGRLLSFAQAQVERERVRVEGPTEWVADTDRGPVPEFYVIHPYLGFVMHPSEHAGGTHGYGFLGNPPPLRVGARDKDSNSSKRSAFVAVVGGSVANSMVSDHGPLLERGLAGGLCFEDRDVQVLNLALPGVKQPQQLLTLEYFLSVGAVIDVLISLDGFNEVVLPIAENNPQGVFPFYPRNWKYYVSGLKDVALMRKVGEVEFWRSLRKQSATLFSSVPLRYSATGNALWLYLDRVLSSSISLRMVDLTLSESRRDKHQGGYMVRGPQREYASVQENYDDLVAVWSRSTQLMHDASRAAGIAAFHFLQPNQRVPNSKPFAAGEREVALPKRQAYDQPARIGYPLLIEEAKRVREAGFPLEDLTMVFAEIEEPLYIDGCCHVSARGSEILVREILRIIRERFEQGEACPRFE